MADGLEVGSTAVESLPSLSGPPVSAGFETSARLEFGPVTATLTRTYPLEVAALAAEGYTTDTGTGAATTAADAGAATGFHGIVGASSSTAASDTGAALGSQRSLPTISPGEYVYAVLLSPSGTSARIETPETVARDNMSETRARMSTQATRAEFESPRITYATENDE